ncbi:ferric reductase like transmembrane component-domain-containing protein [Suillus bovinus]|uniref:ferric reductase like transmembrane component-domain-containing protein n=1 Tax=Suillus bovinus TaxID=48563 RepID=UPI001B866CE9|nr:ferric reductase like transmembrane component-domain-containing protein [Suillus bovinus]KAG2148175.1 ferric reductase like transmembrane component-domain-containing protein [Suillus bovinus]
MGLDDDLVYHADILIFGIILIFTLASLPRAYARFSRRSEWSQGHFLRSIVPVPFTKPRINNRSPSYPVDPKSFVDFDRGNSSTTCAPLTSRHHIGPAHVVDEKALPKISNSDPTVVSSIWHPVASVLQYRVHDNYSINQVLLILAYISIIFYVSFYRSDPFTDPHRAGFVIASQIPFVYALATKNNIIGMMVGVGYEKLNFLHRLVGKLMIIGANVHFIGYVYKWSLAGDIYNKLAEDFVRWGIVALVCLDLLGFCSTEYVRSKSYNLFITSHVVSLIIFLFAACYHEPTCVPYVIAACVFYILDHVVRAIKTRITTAKLRPLPELGITRVEVPSINAGWRAGQHVRLRVLSSSMGWWGWSEVHPFTIANVAETSEGMVLMCKKTGQWTGSLYSMAQTASYGETGKEVGRDVRVMVEGPYGGVGHTVMSSYSGAMFVVGGSGISFALSAVPDLIQAATDVKVIDIVWSVKTHVPSLIPLLPLFTNLVQQSPLVRVNVHIYYTRAVSTTFNVTYLPQGVTILPGRPKLEKLLDAAITNTISAGGVDGMFVGVCGPLSLANTMAHVVQNSNFRLTTAVGGVKLHEESFGW